MSSFTLDLQNFAAKAMDKANEVVGTVVVSVVREIDMRSPVDTGRFRGNWQLGVDSIPQGVAAQFDPTGGVTTTRNLAVIPDEAGGHVYTLANNLPYAMPLEMGHSRQAPQGMVGVTALKFQQIVNQAAGGVE